MRQFTILSRKFREFRECSIQVFVRFLVKIWTQIKSMSKSQWTTDASELRTSKEGIHQRNLKIWADVVVPKNSGVGVDFQLFSDGNFLSGRPKSVPGTYIRIEIWWIFMLLFSTKLWLKQTQWNVGVCSAVSEKFWTHCGSHPDAFLLTSYEFLVTSTVDKI